MTPKILHLPTLVHAAKDVCCDCGGRGFPDDPMPLAHGPPGTGNYVHRRNCDPELDTLCAASSIWSTIRWHWDEAEVKARSPRGWVE